MFPVVLESLHPRSESLILDHPQLALGGLDQSRVVRHQYHATIEVPQGDAQGVDGLDVEVVGGLVQEQQMGSHEGQLHEHHSSLLAAAQVADWNSVCVSLQTVLPELIANYRERGIEGERDREECVHIVIVIIITFTIIIIIIIDFTIW
jgi:hypothetical protein